MRLGVYMLLKNENKIKNIWPRIFLGVFDVFWIALIAFGAFWIGNWSVTLKFDISLKLIYWIIGWY